VKDLEFGDGTTIVPPGYGADVARRAAASTARGTRP